MSQPWHSMFTDSEEESESTTSVHARYENKPPGKSSTASTPASVETPSQQHLSPLDSDATPTPDTTQDNVPALAPQQGGCDALGYSFAKLISSLTDALNACCGTSPRHQLRTTEILIQEAKMASDEQATEPSSNGESTSEDDHAVATFLMLQRQSHPRLQLHNKMVPRNRNTTPRYLAVVKAVVSKTALRKEKQEVHVEEVVDAARKAGAVGDTRVVAPSYLPKDVVQKIPGCSERHRRCCRFSRE
ncbi:hypothetical protein MRX96_007800 [Rhipicephalus microplus]